MTQQVPSNRLPILLAVSVFMQMLDATILNTALPQMAIDLHESPLRMQSAVVSYALTLALLMPLSGYLCDRFGTRRVFLGSMFLFVCGSILCAMSPNLPLLVFARIIQGMGGAMLMPVPRLIVMRAYDKSQILNVLNFIIMPALLGPILGPLLGGYLVEYVGWHWIFLLNVPVGIIGIIMALKDIPNFFAPEHISPFLDKLGFVLFGIGAVGLSMAVEVLGQPHLRWIAALCALLGTFALYIYWKHAERNDEYALYSLRLRFIRTFRLGILGNLFSRLGMAAVPFLLPLLLQVAFGRSPAQSGMTLAPIALAALLTKPIIKPIITRLGYRMVLIWNTRLIGLIIVSLSLLSVHTPLWLLMPLLFFLGMCNSLQYSAMNTLTLADLRPQQTGSGNSLMAVNQQLAISFGIALGALLLNLFSGNNHTDIPRLTTAFHHTFWIIGSITFLSSWVFLRLHPQDGSNLLHN